MVVAIVLLPALEADAAGAGASGQAGCQLLAAVCAVDAVALSMDWYLLRSHEKSRGKALANVALDAPSALVKQLQTVLQSISWREQEASGGADSARLLVDLARPLGTPLPSIWAEVIRTNDVEIVELTGIGETIQGVEDAARSLKLLLAQPEALEGVKLALAGGHDAARVHKLCIATVSDALRLHASDLVENETFRGRFKLNIHEANSLKHMRLNRSAKEAFVRLAASKSQRSSLLTLLAPSCSTKRGRECLRMWLERPCVDVATLQERHDAVEAVVSMLSPENVVNSGKDGVLHLLSSLFRHFHAYERSLSLFTSISETVDSSTATQPSLVEFAELRKWLNGLGALVGEQTHGSEANQSLNALHITHLQPIQTLLSRDLRPFCTLIHQTTTGINHEGETSVTSTSSALHLSGIRAEIRLCETKIEAAVTQTATLLRLARGRIKIVFEDEEQSSFAGIGVVLRVSRQDSHRVQQRSGELVTVFRASRASGVWFSTPTIDSLGAKWKALRRSYEEAEAALVLVLTSAFQSHFHGFLETLVRHIAELDVLVGFALVSHKHKFVKATIWDPQIAESGQEQHCGLRLLNVFDPFKENAAISTGDSGKSSGGLTIQLSSHEGKTFLLLDGDGEAGKPSILKLLGHVVLFNQLGCFVPCQEATLPAFDAIHLRTGAFDQQLYGYSTFMTEMQEMRRIFATMTSASLVLIEDLCRGTSTTEGLALALSMCLHLMETKTVTCFSSQWRELTDQLAQQKATVTPVRADEVHQTQSLPTRTAASFEKLMTDCDLPPDLMALIHQELQQ